MNTTTRKLIVAGGQIVDHHAARAAELEPLPVRAVEPHILRWQCNGRTHYSYTERPKFPGKLNDYHAESLRIFLEATA